MKKEPPLFILLLLVSFSSISAVLFTPSLPEISRYFGISSAKAQITVTLFLVGYAFGQLPYGPLANRFGRKLPLLGGIALAIFSSLLCILSGFYHQFWLLALARLTMALGASAGLKMVFTIIGDVYAQARATKVISYLIISFAIAPGIGVAIGGFLTETFHWESCFYFLAAYGFLLFLLCTRLPETAKEIDTKALQWSQIISGYVQKIHNLKVSLSAVIMGCGTAIIYVFAAQAPFLSIDVLNISPSNYGLLNLIPPIGMVIGGILSTKLATRWDGIKIIGIGLVIMLIGTIGMLTAFSISWISAATLFLPMPFIYIGDSLMYANTTSLAMSHAQNKSNASAMMNFINMLIGVIGVLMIESLHNAPALVMPVIFVILVLIMCGFYFKLAKLLKDPL